MIAHRQEKAWVGYVLVSLLLSPLLGLAVVLLWKPAETPGTAEEDASPVVLHNASTNILTPEEAQALRIRAEEEESKAPSAPDDMAALKQADTGVLKPGEAPVIKQEDN